MDGDRSPVLEGVNGTPIPEPRVYPPTLAQIRDMSLLGINEYLDALKKEFDILAGHRCRIAAIDSILRHTFGAPENWPEPGDIRWIVAEAKSNARLLGIMEGGEPLHCYVRAFLIDVDKEGKPAEDW